jgi:hypothetical protein
MIQPERQQMAEAIERMSAHKGHMKAGPGFQDPLILNARPRRPLAANRTTTGARKRTGWRSDATAG